MTWMQSYMHSKWIFSDCKTVTVFSVGKTVGGYCPRKSREEHSGWFSFGNFPAGVYMRVSKKLSSSNFCNVRNNLNFPLWKKLKFLISVYINFFYMEKIIIIITLKVYNFNEKNNLNEREKKKKFVRLFLRLLCTLFRLEERPSFVCSCIQQWAGSCVNAPTKITETPKADGFWVLSLLHFGNYD